jgi:hypothetical protein
MTNNYERRHAHEREAANTPPPTKRGPGRPRGSTAAVLAERPAHAAEIGEVWDAPAGFPHSTAGDIELIERIAERIRRDAGVPIALARAGAFAAFDHELKPLIRLHHRTVAQHQLDRINDVEDLAVAERKLNQVRDLLSAISAGARSATLTDAEVHVLLDNLGKRKT